MKKMINRSCLTILLLTAWCQVQAQTDSVKTITVGSAQNANAMVINTSAAVTTSDTETPAPVYYVKLTESAVNQSLGGFHAPAMGIIKKQGTSLRELVADAYSISPTLVFGEEEVIQVLYDVDVKLPRNQAELVQGMLQSAIKEHLGVEVQSEPKVVDYYELTAPNGVSKELYRSESTKSRASNDEGVLTASGRTIDSFFIRALERALGVQVLNKTGLEEKYDYQLYWDAEEPESIISALEEQLGLVLVKISKERDVLVVK
ncbi:MAG: TIGR03435 family protein [Bacteroidota bacterium]